MEQSRLHRVLVLSDQLQLLPVSIMALSLAINSLIAGLIWLEINLAAAALVVGLAVLIASGLNWLLLRQLPRWGRSSAGSTGGAGLERGHHPGDGAVEPVGGFADAGAGGHRADHGAGLLRHLDRAVRLTLTHQRFSVPGLGSRCAGCITVIWMSSAPARANKN